MGGNNKRPVFASGSDSISSQFRFGTLGGYNILFRLSAPGPEESLWMLEHFVQSVDDPSFMLPLGDHSIENNPGIFIPVAQKLGEAAAVSRFARVSLPYGPKKLGAVEAYEFIKNDAFALRQAGFNVQIPKNLENRVAPPISVNFSLKNRFIVGRSEDFGMLEFDYKVSLAGEEISAEDFAALAASKEHLVRVKSKWVEVNPEDVSRALEFISKCKGKKPLMETLSLGVSAAESGIEAEFSSGGKNFVSLIEAISPNEELSALKPPEGFRGKLRPYQKRGVDWLDFLSRLGFGALLADDMGLGKTVQVIAHSLRQIKKKGGKPILVVCPTSVISNWAAEFSRFAPGVKVKIHHGVERVGGETFKEEAKGADVVITSYSLAWRDEEELESVKWGLMVLDEAQNIKNPMAKQTQKVKKLSAKHRIALTGTPVENRLSDLWSIMEFLNPGFLYSWKGFKEKFAKPIELHQDERKKAGLRSAISPFILRRLKTDKKIISDLPEKIETVEHCFLTTEQATLYKAIVDSSLDRIEAQEESSKRRMEIFATITKLKQICNHPSNFLKDSASLGERSGKVERLRELVSAMVENRDSCLIFSQYTEMASLIYNNFEKEFDTPFFYLHGGLGRKQRDKIVQEFQADGDGAKILILSLKAGGTGLNLTRATNVIHFDRWWNPAVENQATDRAFRIGQKNNVFVYKFVTKGTIEERIAEILEKKRGLSESVVGSGENLLAELSGAKLREMLSLREY